ncbi:tripartite motif-containing protein 2-like [Anneissia japonica]|uniref:tripartite motif-containing protein 2-like n=1 Tax=Anneissia japonica TaxID=1529436 RepID=UPI0014259BB0|nr:tripartite motif-containing protein 2-like [Anneissia japonica]
MSVTVSQFINDKDLECAICLNRFHQPKTLKCMHTYCQQCIQEWVEGHSKLECPTCGQKHDLTKEDLKQLASNKMISQLLEYAAKIEDQKPAKCSFCDNKPAYYCSTCQLYLCGGPCTKQHKTVSSTKDHQLYTLDSKEEDDKETKCPAHCNTPLEFYCSNCNKSACKRCEKFLLCLQEQHEVTPMPNVVDLFNQNITELLKLAQEVKNMLDGKKEVIETDRKTFDAKLKLYRKAIEIQGNNHILRVKEEMKKLFLDLERIEREVDINSKVKDVDSKMTELNNLIDSINALINKPEERETLKCKKANITALRDKVIQTDIHKTNITPTFIPSTHFDGLMNTEGIGKITSIDMRYKVAEEDKAITITKGQKFVVKVLSPAMEEICPAENDACRLTANIITSLGDVKLETEVVYQGRRQYKITGRCNVEGNWQMKITVGAAHIQGSPVNIKVEKAGLVHTTGNISDYKDHNDTKNVVGVLHTDGCILISCYSKTILRFNQSGLFVDRIQVPQDVMVNRMHQMDDGHLVYGDLLQKCVVMSDNKFQEICLFGKEMLKYPRGLTVNEETRVLYVADDTAHCVFLFNIDDGRPLGKITAEGSEVDQLKFKPQDVTLTKEGHVIVADSTNNNIQIFDANGKFMKILVGNGIKDGQVCCPTGVTFDLDENIIVSSNNKLQLFNKNGEFIKRIDHEGDGLEVPCGITAISNGQLRRVAVANNKANNLKIYNY